MLPKLIISFIMYGPFVILCQKLGLVKNSKMDSRYLLVVVAIVGISTYEYIWIYQHKDDLY